MKKEENIQKMLLSLRKNSAGYGFVTDESIKMFEKQFVNPAFNVLYELGWKEKAKQMLRMMKDYVPKQKSMKKELCNNENFFVNTSGIELCSRCYGPTGFITSATGRLSYKQIKLEDELKKSRHKKIKCKFLINPKNPKDTTSLMKFIRKV